MTFVPGTCYINTNTPPPPQHFWFVLSNPNIDPACVFVANITSWDDFRGDSACRLQDGVHPKIKKDSYVNYEDAKGFAIEDLRKWHAAGLFKVCEPASDELLRAMQQGALNSEFCKNRFKKLLRAQNLPRL